MEEKQPWFAPMFYDDAQITIVEQMSDEQVQRLSKNEQMVLFGTCQRAVTDFERRVWSEAERMDKTKLVMES
jgi:hypothetical protein